MSGRIADLFRKHEEHREQVGEKMERAVASALEEYDISVSIRNMNPNFIELKMDMSGILENLNDLEEFDGVELVQKGSKIRIKKDYTVDGDEEGNVNRG